MLLLVKEARFCDDSANVGRDSDVDSDSDGESKLSTLIRNSYIMIGLLAIVLIMLLSTTLIAIAKGMFKGKAKYKTLPKHDY